MMSSLFTSAMFAVIQIGSNGLQIIKAAALESFYGIGLKIVGNKQKLG